MKLSNHLFFFVLLVFSWVFTSNYSNAQPLIKPASIHIITPLSDKLSYRFEKYLFYAYNQLGYKVTFEKLLTARARKLVDSGRLDALMIAEKEIEQSYKNILRVPVMLARGSLILYCNAQVNCLPTILNDPNNIVGVIRGPSMSASFMKNFLASNYAVKDEEALGAMLIKGRLNYILIVKEDQFGKVGDFDDSNFQKVEVQRSEGYHYIHKSHEKILPQLTEKIQQAIEEFGPLVEPIK